MGTRLDVVAFGFIPVPCLGNLGEGGEPCAFAGTEVEPFNAAQRRFANQLSGGKHGAFPLDAFMWGVLKTCRRYHESTGGAFDIALEPLQDFGRQPVENRREEDLAHARAASGMHNVVLDEARQTVQFAHPLARIDLGGFGKGFALEQLQPILADAGVRNALISFGEKARFWLWVTTLMVIVGTAHGIRDIHTGQTMPWFSRSMTGPFPLPA